MQVLCRFLPLRPGKAWEQEPVEVTGGPVKAFHVLKRSVEPLDAGHRPLAVGEVGEQAVPLREALVAVARDGAVEGAAVLLFVACPLPIVFVLAKVGHQHVEGAGAGQGGGVHAVVVVFVELAKQAEAARHLIGAAEAGQVGLWVFGRVFEGAEQAGVLRAVGAELLVVGQTKQARPGVQNVRLVQHVADGQVRIRVGRGRHIAQHIGGDGVAQLRRQNFGYVLVHGAENVLRAIGRDELEGSRLASAALAGGAQAAFLNGQIQRFYRYRL